MGVRRLIRPPALLHQRWSGNDVTLRPRSVVFRSLVRNDAVIGYKSAVVGSELRQGQVIPNRLIYANDEVFGRVEW